MYACTADLGTESADESAKNWMVGNAGQFGFLFFFSFLFLGVASIALLW